MAESGSVLFEALRVLNIPQVAELCGVGPLKAGTANKSPFRDEKKPSFFVHKHGQKAEDYGTGESWSTWSFALAVKGGSKGDVASWLIRAAGLDPDKDKMSSSQLKLMSQKTRMKVVRKHREKVYEVREIGAEPGAWPAVVRGRFAEGWRYLMESDLRRDRIAEQRGWTVDFVYEQLRLGKLSYPMLPWSDKRGVAFQVQRPVLDGHGALCELLPVGYHQRFMGQGGSKMWIYVPYTPKDPATDYQRDLCGLGTCRVPAYPFVLGELEKPRLVVILEGQWDAITFWHAAGGADLDGVAVFGLRGASSCEVLLSSWGRWLKRHRPVLWLIGDRDEAGKRWVEPSDAGLGLPDHTFADRLKALTRGRLVASFLRDEVAGKDFNDVYGTDFPSREDIAAWMRKEGLL